ncbi:MAG: hypothetical protein ACI9OJ_003137 [Myxococcota bacterium]|jgi:hypothetical protein
MVTLCFPVCASGRRSSQLLPVVLPVCAALLFAQPAKRVRVPTPAPSHAKRPALLGECDGFQVHTATCVPPNSPDQLERLLRYFGRPALPCGRIEGTPFSNRSVFKLKRPRRGVTEFLFDPVGFLARTPALIPRPRTNQMLPVVGSTVKLPFQVATPVTLP